MALSRTFAYSSTTQFFASFSLNTAFRLFSFVDPIGRPPLFLGFGATAVSLDSVLELELLTVVVLDVVGMTLWTLTLLALMPVADSALLMVVALARMLLAQALSEQALLAPMLLMAMALSVGETFEFLG